MTEVAIRVSGREYRGWKTARVTRSIEALSGSFDLNVSERWENQKQPWPIGEGDLCAVLVSGQTVINGFIDRRELSFSATDHSVSVSGRDRAADLVDSSALLDKWEFSHVDVLSLARQIARPYGLAVSLQPGLVLPSIAVPKKLSIDPGDTAASALETVCKIAGLLAVSDGQGGIMLTRSGSARCTTEIVEGENMLTGKATFDYSGRFASYLVLGAHKGNDEFNGEASAAVKGTADDDGIARKARTLVIRPEGNVTIAQAKKRAEWEAATRAAKSGAVTVTVQGWTQADGSLWPLNRLVRVRSPLLGVDGDMLITQAVYSLSTAEGSTTELSFKRPAAFDPLPRQTSSGDGLWKEIRKGAFT
jgi:prophage tail gpP-like protein